jgi:leucyl-tRNA synthetase
LDSVIDTPRSWVHIAPDKPDIFKSLMEEDDCRLRVTAQKALLSLTQPMSLQKSSRTTESRLVALTKALIAYDDVSRTLPRVQYHSARIFICLVAPLAPSVAEEHWVLLHCGSVTPSAGGDEEDLEEVLFDQEMVE